LLLIYDNAVYPTAYTIRTKNSCTVFPTIFSHLICCVECQLGEYSDPFDLKTTAAAAVQREEPCDSAASDVILPLSEDDYCVPYEMKDRRQGTQHFRLMCAVDWSV